MSAIRTTIARIPIPDMPMEQHDHEKGMRAMPAPEDLPEDDPRHHTIKLKGMLNDVITHAREDVGKVHDPKAQALFETTAEVLGGLVTAFEHFEQRAEAAWR